MAGIVSVLIYVQMAVNQENVSVSLEIEPPETEAENISTEQVGEETEFIPNTSTYGNREIGGTICPGVLASSFALTL